MEIRWLRRSDKRLRDDPGYAVRRLVPTSAAAFGRCIDRITEASDFTPSSQTDHWGYVG